MPKIMATYNRNEMLVQRKEALNKWSSYLESLLQENVISLQRSKFNMENNIANPTTRSKTP